MSSTARTVLVQDDPGVGVDYQAVIFTNGAELIAYRVAEHDDHTDYVPVATTLAEALAE